VGFHTASYSVGTAVFFPGVQRSLGKANHSTPSSVEAKNAWSHTSSPPVCVHGVDIEKFTLFLTFHMFIK
jgi:hypothetical protein